MEASYQLNASAALPQKRTLVHIEYEAWWAADPVWTLWRKVVVPAGLRTLDLPARGLVAIPTTPNPVLPLIVMEVKLHR